MKFIPQEQFLQRISSLVKERRKARGFTQHEFAEWAEISRGSVVNIENGKFSVSAYVLLKVCHIFGIPFVNISQDIEEPRGEVGDE